MERKPTAFRAVILLIAILLGAVGFLAPAPEGLSFEGFKCLCVVLAIILLWCTEAVPVLAICALTVVIIPCSGLLTVNEVWAASGTNGLFFILAAFGIAAGMIHTNLPNYLIRFLLRITGNNTSRIVAGFVVMTSLLSVFVIDSAACMMATFALAVLGDEETHAPGQSKLGKGLMIGIPFGAYCGGIAFPSSSIVNIFAISALEQFGYSVTYLQWAIVGVPLAIVTTALAAFLVPKLCKPEPLTDEQYDSILMKSSEGSSLEAKDAKMLVIFLGMILFWVFSDINMVVVACAGVFLMFVPGIDIITGKQYLEQVNPASLAIVATVMVIVGAVQATDLSDWIVSVCFSGIDAWPAFAVLLLVGVIAVIMHTLLPAGIACLTVIAFVVFPVAAAAGLSVGGVAILLSFWCTALFLLPLDPLYLMTYGFGYYSFGDVLKLGAPVTVIFLPIVAVVISAMSAVAGIA